MNFRFYDLLNSSVKLLSCEHSLLLNKFALTVNKKENRIILFQNKKTSQRIDGESGVNCGIKSGFTLPSTIRRSFMRHQIFQMIHPGTKSFTEVSFNHTIFMDIISDSIFHDRIARNFADIFIETIPTRILGSILNLGVKILSKYDNSMKDVIQSVNQSFLITFNEQPEISEQIIPKEILHSVFSYSLITKIE